MKNMKKKVELIKRRKREERTHEHDGRTFKNSEEASEALIADLIGLNHRIQLRDQRLLVALSNGSRNHVRRIRG